jgi:hypothetical protein
MPLLCGCLVFAERPEGAIPCSWDEQCEADEVCNRQERTCVPACVDEECPDGFACASRRLACETRCMTSSSCQAGYLCSDSGRCELPCQASACYPYVCDTINNRCYTRCTSRLQCANDRQCCSTAGVGGCTQALLLYCI